MTATDEQASCSLGGSRPARRFARRTANDPFGAAEACPVADSASDCIRYSAVGVEEQPKVADITKLRRCGLVDMASFSAAGSTLERSVLQDTSKQRIVAMRLLVSR